MGHNLGNMTSTALPSGQIRNQPSEQEWTARHVVWVYPASIGRELDTATWLQTTQELRRLGWQVTLVGEGPTGVHEIDGVQVMCLATVHKFMLRWMVFHLILLGFLLRRWYGIDVILFHQMSLPWVLPLRLLRLLTFRRRPLFVMDTRDLNAIDGSLKSRLRVGFFRLLHRVANRWADGQTAITPRMARLVDVPSGKLWGYWPSGVNLDRFAEVYQGRHWPQANEPVQLMYVGILLSERNPLPLCRAVEAANHAGMSFHLTFVGSGPESANLEEFAKGTEGRIRVLPPVAHEQIPELLRQTHVGVTSLPEPDNIKYQASSPIKLFEYMAAGLPILSTRNVCHADVVGDGQYAFWAGDASEATLFQTLSQVWRAREQLAILGHEARLAVDAWTWQSAGRQLDGALRFGLARVRA